MRTIEKPIAKQKIDLESQSARDHVTRCHLMADVQRLQTNPRKKNKPRFCANNMSSFMINSGKHFFRLNEQKGYFLMYLL